MASYAELFDQRNNSSLRNKIAIACIVAADGILKETVPPTNQAEREAWAVTAFQSPMARAEEMLMALLAANKELSLAQIEGASDAAIQTNVDDAVDLFANNLPVPA